MKKLYLLFISLCLWSSCAYSQAVKPDVILSPNGPNTSVYWNVKFKTMIIPHWNISTPPIYQDTIGAFVLNADTTDKHIHFRYKMGAGGLIPLANLSDISGRGTWGSITGTLSDQTDLQTVLNAKESLSNKATAFGTLNNTLYPTTQAVSNYIVAFGYITAGSTNTLTGKSISGSTNTITNVSLVTGIVGNLPVTNLNGGTSASSTTFWRGDGVWAVPGVTASSFVFSEIPSGAINGTNVTFTLANTPISGTVRLYKNGLRLGPTEYSISGSTITYTAAPSNVGITDVLLADYLK